MDRIECRAEVCNGNPVVRGTRITVHTVLSHLSAGDSIDDILEAFPRLNREDVLGCLTYANRLGQVHTTIELAS